MECPQVRERQKEEVRYRGTQVSEHRKLLVNFSECDELPLITVQAVYMYTEYCKFLDTPSPMGDGFALES